jgi:murein L,D-transpeptidase YafK
MIRRSMIHRRRRFARPCLSLGFLAVITAGAASADEAYVPDPRPDRVPAYFIELPASTPGVLVADAASASLLRLDNTVAGVRFRDRRYLSVGEKGVGKQVSGDKRTPLGAYFITEELDTTRLDPKYGAAAFVLDYPNAWDRYRERSGHGIWLHGVHPETPMRPARDTDGCLALPNDQLLSLRPDLLAHEMPVIVTRKAQWTTAAELAALRQEFRAALEEWRRAFEAGDIHAYLAMYDEAFRARGLGLGEWARFRMGSFAARDEVAVSLDDVMLLRDPEEPDLYIARFVQTTRGAATNVTVRKRLYWLRDGAGWRILTEDAG